jgi:hypothetical protein
MPWANIDDQFPDHPKVAGLSDAAFRLHVVGICYCNRHMTNGKIDRDEVPRLVRRFKKAALEELIDKGIWYDRNGVGIYEIHDFLQWNRSREDIVSERDRIHRVRSDAGKKGAKARWQTG